MARTCMHCESGKTMRRFTGEAFSVEHAGLKSNLKGLSGWRCEGCGEIEFDAKSASRYAATGDALVLRSRREQGAEIRRIRKKLGLSQMEAARLTGGGHNAFSRYEKGEVTPVAAVANLFRLLDKNPKRLKELPTVSPAEKRGGRAQDAQGPRAHQAHHVVQARAGIRS